MTTKYANKSHKHPQLEDQLLQLQRQVEQLSKQIKQQALPKLTIYSAADDICIGMQHAKWHRIVCQYEGNRCLGGPRPHWHSDWTFNATGLSLACFLDENWKGWHGQYVKGEMRYDEIPRHLLSQHYTFLQNYIKTEFVLWLPCHIYDDINSRLYRP